MQKEASGLMVTAGGTGRQPQGIVASLEKQCPLAAFLSFVVSPKNELDSDICSYVLVSLTKAFLPTKPLLQSTLLLVTLYTFIGYTLHSQHERL